MFYWPSLSHMRIPKSSALGRLSDVSFPHSLGLHGGEVEPEQSQDPIRKGEEVRDAQETIHNTWPGRSAYKEIALRKILYRTDNEVLSPSPGLRLTIWPR